jgi:glycerol-3-phosphate dehydrogenase
MGKSDASGNKAIMRALTDPSLEFDVFEMARQRLVEVFIAEGHERLEAKKIAVYIVEGLQHVPKLLNVLTRIKLPEQTEILEALGPVLDEASALDKARRMLLHLDADQEHKTES